MPTENVLILDPDTLDPIAPIDESYSSFEYVRRWRASDTFKMVVNKKRTGANEIQKGRLVYVPTDAISFRISQVEAFQDGQTDDLIVTGQSLGGFAMHERVIELRRGQKWDKWGRKKDKNVESVMKHYVQRHVVNPRRNKRKIPNFAIATWQGRGEDTRGWGRWQYVLDMLMELGDETDMGWDVTTDLATGLHTFDVVPGVDRTDSVYFDFAFETLEEWRETVGDIDSKSVAYVASAGKVNKRRTIRTWRGSPEPSGLDRREMFVDTDIPKRRRKRLKRKGKRILKKKKDDIELDATLHLEGAFKYREHWNIGDLVTVGNKARGVTYETRIEEIRVTPRGAESVSTS